MPEFSYACSLPVTWQDGGNTIRHIGKPHAARKVRLCISFIERELSPIEVWHYGNMNFRPFWLLWPWPWPGDLYIQRRHVSPDGDIPNVRKWTSYVKASKLSCWGRQMRGFSYACSLPVTQQWWRSHHSIRRSRNPRATRKPHGSVCYRTKVMGDRNLHYGNRHFGPYFCSYDLDLDPMTFIYKLDSYSLEIHRMCKYELPTWRLLKVIVWQTDRQDIQTESTKIINYAASWLLNNITWYNNNNIGQHWDFVNATQSGGLSKFWPEPVTTRRAAGSSTGRGAIRPTVKFSPTSGSASPTGPDHRGRRQRRRWRRFWRSAVVAAWSQIALSVERQCRAAEHYNVLCPLPS